MKRELLVLLAFGAAMAVVPLVVRSDFLVTLVTMALYSALLGISWNILGGFGGQYSFGHAVFFGMGAYVDAVAQVRFGLNAWAALPLAVCGGALVGLLVGGLVFRYGLKGSYFALVTLAFAEVFRVLANTFDFTGAGVGMMIQLKPGADQFQFADQSGFLWAVLAMVMIGLLASLWLRHSRFGAHLVAVRENEDAARALGVDVFRVKLGAIALSGALRAAGGFFYMQKFNYIDPPLGFGATVSVEALLVAIVGGIGTVIGPVVGAFALAALSQITTLLIGKDPALSVALYGVILVLMVAFLPSGLTGLGEKLFGRDARGK